MQPLHTHRFFTYGVIVGLAIREALVRAGPHVFLPSGIEPWKAHLESLRLIIFLLAITCFYFGAAEFFEKVYLNSETAPHFKKKSYGLDFGLGLVHFIVFFAWSLTITEHSRFQWGLSPFFTFMSAVLLYDLVWVIANLRLDTLQAIKLWTFTAFVTSFLACVILFTVRAWVQNDVIAEESTFLIVGAYLMVDITELFSGRQFFSEWIGRLLPKLPSR